MLHETIDIHCDYACAGIPKPDYQPKLYTYILDNYEEMKPDKKRPTLVICPGGGYWLTSFREGEHIAIRFNALGFNVCILKYSCAPATFPAPQLELAAAVALVRSRKEEWHVDDSKVFVMGFSAGGHLAASLGTLWDKDLPEGSLVPHGFKPADVRPDGLVLCYPVITSGPFAHEGSFRNLLGSRYDELRDFVSLEKRVSGTTPPTFIWHTFEDDTVPAENALLFAAALRKEKIPFELHIYEHGGHGLAAANEETVNSSGWGIQTECQNWIDQAAAWIRSR